MKNNTDIDYKNALKAKYEQEKIGVFHCFLKNPSPAQLRELCLLKFDNGLNKIDEVIFRIYFKISDTDDLRSAIYKYHIPKLKSIGNFLNEENKDTTTSIQNLNLIAVLVDFNPRPFNRFTKNILDPSETIQDPLNTEIKVQNNEHSSAAVVEINEPQNNNGISTMPKSNLKKKIGIGIIAFIGLFSVGYTSKELINTEKECMQWNQDHYELVDCTSKKEGFAASNAIKPIIENEVNLKKITPCDTTVFFKNGKPLIWYCKINNHIECFNTHGFHPESGKPLKPITNYIIHKYLKNIAQ